MIRYPKPLHVGQTIGVTATSSGVPEELHHLLHASQQQFENRGFAVEIGATAWTQEKSASAPKKVRAAELLKMLHDPRISVIIPPWGGTILMEILPLIDWDAVEPKWILGYSDTSTLLFAMTVKTGIATAHGTNFVDLRSDAWDPTTSKFLEILSSSTGSIVEQYSSEHYQSKWQHTAPSNPYVFQLDSDTKWEVLGGGNVSLSGRLLGGCVDTIGNLVGTPFGNIFSFQKDHLNDEPILWYLENCELSAPDFHRTLLQMHYAGWFDNASGIIFGRTPAGQAVDGFTLVDSMQRIKELTQLPIIYNADIGHVPPQITFVNGAVGKVRVADGKAIVITEFI